MKAFIGGTTVTGDKMTFLEEWRKADETGDDSPREGIRQSVREVMAEVVTELVGADIYVRSEH
jgi:hypothetical protein